MAKPTDVSRQLDIFTLFLCKTPVADIARQFNTTPTNIGNHVHRAWKRIRGNLLAQIAREEAAAKRDPLRSRHLRKDREATRATVADHPGLADDERAEQRKVGNYI